MYALVWLRPFWNILVYLFSWTFSLSRKQCQRKRNYSKQEQKHESWNYWDSLLSTISRFLHFIRFCLTDVVTCISLDADGSHLISGSADLTCAVWMVEQTSGFSTGLSEKPIQMMYGHTACITAVAMYGDLDIAASGAKVTTSYSRLIDLHKKSQMLQNFSFNLK